MLKNINRFMTAMLVFLFLPGGPAWAESRQYQYPENRELVALVRDAAQLVRTEGEAAFAQFRVKGSKWFQGDKYVFVDSLDGVELVNPAFPHLEGKNLMHLKDHWGKPLVKRYIDEVTREKGKTEGWTHYLWPKPGKTKETWKSTYVALTKAPTGKQYVVGSGRYNLRMEKSLVEEQVNDAVALIRQMGNAAFPVLRDKSSGFIFRDTYVFVNNENGVELVNPMFPRLEGKCLWDLRDAKGNFAIRDMVKTVKEQGEAWLESEWPKPGESLPSIKPTFVKGITVDGELLIVGCGVYLD